MSLKRRKKQVREHSLEVIPESDSESDCDEDREVACITRGEPGNIPASPDFWE